MIKRIDPIKGTIVKRNGLDVKKMEKKKNQQMMLEVAELNDGVQNHLPIKKHNQIQYLNQKKPSDMLLRIKKQTLQRDQNQGQVHSIEPSQRNLDDVFSNS